MFEFKSSDILEELRKHYSKLKGIVNEPRSKWYSISYIYFIDYFKGLDEITKEDLIFGISMVYSWMPTIPGVKIKEFLEKEDIELFKSILENKNDFDEKKSIERIKKNVNNSLIGASKLIHFLNPEKYPMWDKNIRELLKMRESIDDYLKYRKYCNELINSPEYEKMKEVFRKIHENPDMNSYSDYRIIEQCLWLLAKVKKLSKKEKNTQTS